MRPRKSRIHPAVDDDFGTLFEEGLNASAGTGWNEVHDVWLRKGLPYPVPTLEHINGFEMKLLDEFGIRWVFGWRAADSCLVLFGVRTQRREPADPAIDLVRPRVEAWQ
jgi:hypothetical protein